MKTLVVISIMLGVWAAFTLALNLPRERRLQRLARSRAGVDSFATVQQSLPDVPLDVLLEIYRAVQHLIPGEDFPVRAEDNLWQTLEIDQGNLDDLIEELVGSPSGAPAASASGTPIETFGDLARATWENRRRKAG